MKTNTATEGLDGSNPVVVAVFVAAADNDDILKLYYLNKTEVLKTNPLTGIQKFKILSKHQLPVLRNFFHYSSFTSTQANYFYPCCIPSFG